MVVVSPGHGDTSPYGCWYRTERQHRLLPPEWGGIVATECHCTPDRGTDRRSVCKSLQLLLQNTL
ncbi:hypothetical protein EA473_19040 [Natrarchaeobius chitinivorans]|uniref:Uncharacterized protein n=1 Tax=Natrarchaeobius chitinivorans TaxID=1679083 RepID=A0A3N6LNT9_NATCH|nr:hypothetical protein EA473_19040 [Natrarchaeobius chitinivorans]